MFETLIDAPEVFQGETSGVAPDAQRNADVVRKFLNAVEEGRESEAIDHLVAPDALAVEFPNRLTPKGARRDLAAMREAGERGRRVCPQQRYEIRSLVAVGDVVAVEMVWVATLAIPLGSIPAGGEMRAHFAAFYEVRDGKIIAIRNYDCFTEF